MGRVIGIDLGTTNSVAAYWKGKRPRIIENEYASFTPSVVWVERGAERVGRDAKDRLASGSANIVYSIKRFMGVDYEDPQAQKAMSRVGFVTRKSTTGEIEVLLDGRPYSPTQISALILKQMKQDAEIKLGEEVTHAVITVPAYFGQRQKNATREAGRLAGLVVPRIISEPTAAALAFGVDEDLTEPHDVLVYDLGGGTFDVSILSIIDNNFDVLSVDGDRFLGGDDFDDLLIREMLEQIRREHRADLSSDPVAMMRLKVLAEKAKIELSRLEESRIIGEAIAQQGGRPINVSMTITRSRFEALISPLVNQSIEIVYRSLEGAGLRPDDLDRVLLVGGSTRVPLVRQRLRETFGDKIQIDVDPMQCVALGAAAQTAFLTDDELQGRDEEQRIPFEQMASPVFIEKAIDMPVITMQDMISKFIGIETDGGDIVPVIPKGTLYPTAEPFRQAFQTNRAGQQTYELPIYESETGVGERAHWEWIGVVRNEKLPPGLPKASDVMVELSIDKDGILYVGSYLKNDPLKDNPEKGTLERRSFHFGGAAQAEPVADNFEQLDFHAFLFRAICGVSSIRKHLNPTQVATAEGLVSEAQAVIASRDERRADALLSRMLRFREELPVPVMDLFWAMLIIENTSVVAPTERSSVQQTMTSMEQAISANNIDSANQHLQRLRQQTEMLFKKYPSNLLMKRG
jgi:molecular chaperone DnaK